MEWLQDSTVSSELFGDNSLKMFVNFSVYLEVSGSERIFLTQLTNTAEDRAFSIKVSQLSAYDNLAPAGCLQYYSEPEGRLKSFNYDNDYSQVLKYRNPSYFVSFYHNDSMLYNINF